MLAAQLLKDIRQLFHSWWRCDRIRISPAESRFFAIQTGSRLLIQGNVVNVLRRRELVEHEPEYRIQVELQTESGTLLVQANSGQQVPALYWITPAATRQLIPEDIQIISAEAEP